MFKRSVVQYIHTHIMSSYYSSTQKTVAQALGSTDSSLSKQLSGAIHLPRDLLTQDQTIVYPVSSISR